MATHWLDFVVGASAAGLVTTAAKLFVGGSRDATRRILLVARPGDSEGSAAGRDGVSVTAHVGSASKSDKEAEVFLRKYLEAQTRDRRSLDESDVQSGEVSRD